MRRIIRRNEKRTISVFLWIAMVLFLAACGKMQDTEVSDPERRDAEISEIELFLFSPCESCREEEKFQTKVLEILEEQHKKAKVRVYNVFQDAGMKHLKKRMQELEKETDLSQLPVAVVGKDVFAGTYEEVGRQVAAALNGKEPSSSEETEQTQGEKQNKEVKVREKSIEDGLKQLEDSGTEMPVFVLFTTFSCESCQTVEKFFENLDSGSGGYAMGNKAFQMLSGSILEAKNLELLNGLFEWFRVPSEEQKVPILFWEQGYLAGEDEICREFEACLLEAKGGRGKEFFLGLGEQEQKSGKNSTLLWGTAAAAGFLNGLNPCGASMLLMVLSVLLLRKTGFLKAAFAYLGGKFLAYVLMGAGAFSVFSTVNLGGQGSFQKGLSIIFAVLALFLSLLNFRDYFFAGKGEYGRIKAQLPRKLREWNHHRIGRLKDIPERFLVPTVFALGTVISAGEFFCTGQIYLASIVYLIKESSGETIVNYLYLIIYTAALCIPQLLLVLVVQRARSMAGASKLALRGMPAVKLIYGMLFLILVGMLFFF